MGRILDVVEEFLKQENWLCMPVENLACTLAEHKTSFRTGFTGKNSEFSCYAQERVEQEQFLFYSIFPSRVPEPKLRDVAEFITRANAGMAVGNFEMDFSDGEVRYKTSADLEGVAMTGPMVRNLIYTNVLTLDRYIPGLMRVIYAGIAPAAAIQEIEDK